MQVYGVVGGGLMGAGIAYAIASALDAKVLIREVSGEACQAARQRVEGLIQRAVRKGTPAAAAEAWLGRIVPPPRLLCSNTSGISITMIAGATKHPERVVGTHFFNPVPVMKLVEIVTGLATDPTTVERARAFCGALGKETILVKDSPGFVVTRLGQALMCEAVRCLEHGVASAEDIDRGMRLGYNYPLGPLELIDLIGVDTELRVMQSMFEELGETFRPSPLMKAMVAAGRLGRKSGRGFHTYRQADR